MRFYHLRGPAPYSTHSSLGVDEEGGAAVVLDPAPAAGQFNSLLKKHGVPLTHILLTHGHFDHVYGLEELKKAWPNAKVLMFGADAVGDEQRPVRAFDAALRDGEVVRVGGADFTVYHTPGHTPGSCCFFVEGLLFCGDTLFQGGVGRTDLDGGDWHTLCQSLGKLVSLGLPGDTKVLPGHGGFSTLAQEQDTNPYLKG